MMKKGFKPQKRHMQNVWKDILHRKWEIDIVFYIVRQLTDSGGINEEVIVS